MKNIFIIIILTVTISSFFAGCEKDAVKYSYEHNMLNFYSSTEIEDSLERYTFFFEDLDVIYDTVWCKVTTLGFLSNKDRPFVLKQIKSGFEDAVPGVHYVPLDDPDLQKYYIIPKNAVENTIPIVLKRDASLKKNTYRLDITFGENEFFREGYKSSIVKKIEFTDRLSKPVYWSWFDNICDNYFGTYGPVKHQFMIDNSEFKWNDEFLVNELKFGDISKVDRKHLDFLGKDFQRKLDQYNEERAQQGEDVLTEADGRIVVFQY